jgi:hypothetical protein
VLLLLRLPSRPDSPVSDFAVYLALACAYASGMTWWEQANEDLLALARAPGVLEAPRKRAAEMVARCLISGHKRLMCGGGARAADTPSQATEVLCRYPAEWRPFVAKPW